MNVAIWGQTSDLISTSRLLEIELYFLLPVLSGHLVLSAGGGDSAYEKGGDARRLA